MGYYTNYELEIIEKPGHCVDEEKVIEKFSEISGYGGEYGPFEHACKWYDHDANSRTVSAFFANAVLKIEGKGEGQGDHWVHAYHNGVKIWNWSAPSGDDVYIAVPPETLAKVKFIKASSVPTKDLSVAEQFSAIIGMFHEELE